MVRVAVLHVMRDKQRGVVGCARPSFEAVDVVMAVMLPVYVYPATWRQRRRSTFLILVVLGVMLFGHAADGAEPRMTAATVGIDHDVIFTPPGTTTDGALVQGLLNQGNIVDILGGCDPTIASCPTWLAGHRSTHGSVFANVPNLQLGDRVTVEGVGFNVDQVLRIYSVGTRVESYLQPGDTGLWLQTCDGDTHDYLVHAYRIPVPNYHEIRIANPRRFS